MHICVVIPFRDRDQDRLRRAVASILRSNGDFKLSVVISDYGSADNTVAESVAAEFENASVAYTPADHWNRSAAINAGVNAAHADFYLLSDADLIWPENTIANAARNLNQKSDAILVFDVRYLREETPVELYDSEHLSPDQLDNWAKVNPRWGEGICLVSRRVFEKVGGYDSRMTIYGYEDNDFTRRARGVGIRVQWVKFTDCPVYHVWHLPVGSVVAKSDKAVARAYKKNGDIYKTDRSVVRNVRGGGVGSGPLVSVIIATKGRAELLRECLASILCQTVQDFEVIVVDDGMLDDSRGVVESFADSRLKYVGVEESQGISAARNLGASYASGRFVAVMDDDDICLPNRFEVSLRAIGPGVDGCVGGFITFYDDGRVESWDDPLPDAEGSFVRGGFAGHPTWMVRREVFELFPYDESFTSSVDNNIALRMINSGVRLVHTGAPHVLRRVHEGQVTNKDAQFQGFGALIDRSWLWSGYSGVEVSALKNRSQTNAPKNRATLYESVFLPYLPDDLVTKKVDAVVYCRADAEAVEKVGPVLARCEVVDADGELVFAKYRFDGDWFTRARLAQCGAVVEVVSFCMSSREDVRQYVVTDPVFAVSVPWRVITEQHPEAESFVLTSSVGTETTSVKIQKPETDTDEMQCTIAGPSSSFNYSVVKGEV